MENLRGILPAAIQVHTKGVAPVVSSNDSIRIEHGDNLEDELLAEDLRILVRRGEQEVNAALDQI